MAKWIQKLNLKKGALRAQAQAEGAIGPDGRISLTWLKAKAAGGGTTARRARLALAFRKMKH